MDREILSQVDREKDNFDFLDTTLRIHEVYQVYIKARSPIHNYLWKRHCWPDKILQEKFWLLIKLTREVLCYVNLQGKYTLLRCYPYTLLENHLLQRPVQKIVDFYKFF